MNILKKKIFWLGLAAVILFSVAAYLGTAQRSGEYSGISQASPWFVAIVCIAALVDSINPCAFSVLLLTVGFLFSLGSERRNIMKTGLIYIFGVFATYVLIGLGVLRALSFFGVPNFMAKAGALLIILAGALDIIGDLFPRFPIKLKIPAAAHRTMARLMGRAAGWTALVLGVFVGLVEFPCTGGPYLMILGMLHDAKSSAAMAGFGYLVLYNLIFVLPLIVILLIASDVTLLEKANAWKRENSENMRLYGGLAMLVLGILILLI